MPFHTISGFTVFSLPPPAQSSLKQPTVKERKSFTTASTAASLGTLIQKMSKWSLPMPNAGTVLTLTKHINNREFSSILYKDLAAAIIGGKDTSNKGKNELLGCGKNGGQIGVTANTSNPLYNTANYKNSGAKPNSIIIKLVKAPSS
ncbi:hypothetical protein LEL_05279 [Akanthomyces lecanii RCEF 1005]|uniref:Uncharacterized protein n=1 Tax=Akanthomyces lecanii RCEF 1005 TaxID=1081108 RepID=A0A168HY12_CORDF|nr:hypothetical protein LEL_05279 [Akanthomyces lecanii RCEF 1005]